MSREIGTGSKVLLDIVTPPVLELLGANVWNLTDEAGEVDVTGFDTADDATQLEPGRRSRRLSINAHWDSGVAGLYGALPAFAPRSTVYAKAYIDDDPLIDKFYLITGKVKSCNPSVDCNGAVDLTMDILVTALIYPT